MRNDGKEEDDAVELPIGVESLSHSTTEVRCIHWSMTVAMSELTHKHEARGEGNTCIMSQDIQEHGWCE